MSSSPTTYDREILIAEYTLGLLNSQESSQAQQLLGEDIQAAAVALKWESHFLELVDLLAPVHPGPQSLQRLQATLGHSTTKRPANPATPATIPAAIRKVAPIAQPPIRAPERTAASAQKSEQEAPLTVATVLRTREKPLESPQNRASVPATEKKTAASASHTKAPTGSPKKAMKPEPTVKPVSEPVAKPKKGNIWFWRIASGIFASIAIVLGLMPNEPAAPPITVVEVAATRAAIMQAPGQSSTPGWVVTIDPQGNVLMNPQVRSDVPADASVQLWTYNKTMTQPRSLGLIDVNQPVTVPATLMGEIGPDQLFEMTQEPAGGSPTASPSGPILFIGRVVTFGRSAVNPPPADGLTPGQ
ncbi:hypothetical protein CR155_17580 [Pollutimonas nitritireducens]|uniref:Anti-sigma K factor RskA C-terminal domain-containing protein n=1 Tax=Pollutimonas nitritireducens TaxID=2045209 RepID=A0A2N4UC53_9BURK|nr:anti-sigma factor [Pollutimonas nitritireducens]PLC52600.1 hypothetical protein CR155_17580 [Pollutimonas nitritireducens]